ncbi:transposase [Methylomonas sp. 11b]|uniref:transposase n=1 Tax=Methylomonas sp. 11b TaxID=1168169 RepID=UPI00047948A6
MAGRFHAPGTGPVVLDSWQYQRQRIGLKLYGYVILENHLHFIAQAPELDKYVASFKAYTSRRIINHLQQQKAELLLQRRCFANAAHKQDREYQFWQEGVHAELILNEAIMRESWLISTSIRLNAVT